jgi:very-short-patch-repair endonuclease
MTELVRLSRGCWAPAPEAADLEHRCARLLGVVPAHTAIVDLSAGRLYGMWLPPARPDERVAMAVYAPGQKPEAMSRPKRAAIAIHRRTIKSDELTMLGQLPVTTVARTWRDLAATLSLEDLVAAGDWALRADVELAQLRDICQRMRGRRGAKKATVALELLDGRSRSRPESHLRMALRSGGLGMFVVNEPVNDRYGQWLAEPDLSCIEARIALEYQGEHHAELDQMRKDITRSTDLRDAGWIVLMYGPAQVFGRPWLIAPEVRRLFAQRSPHLLSRVAT